ncbi:MAG: hypothetical protein ABI134_33400, partial [Byssovorax sp.]
MSQNPYDWTRHAPRRPIVREKLIENLSQLLRDRKEVVLLGGRGMGKSVLLQQLAAQIQKEDPSARVFLFDGPPTPSTLRASLRVLGKRLGLAKVAYLQVDELFDQYWVQIPVCMVVPVPVPVPVP